MVEFRFDFFTREAQFYSVPLSRIKIYAAGSQSSRIGLIFGLKQYPMTALQQTQYVSARPRGIGILKHVGRFNPAE